jgi:hypothetical protein
MEAMRMSEPSGSVHEPRSAWDDARRRVQHKRDFRAGLVAYVVVNAFFVVIWLLTGRGYFWPGWVLAAWAVGILLDAYNTWVRRPVSEADVERELRRTRSGT